MNKKLKSEEHSKSKATCRIFAVFFITAFAFGSILTIATATTGYAYQCFGTIHKCVCNGSDNDFNTMKSKECKGEVVDNKCTKKLINNNLELAIQ